MCLFFSPHWTLISIWIAGFEPALSLCSSGQKTRRPLFMDWMFSQSWCHLSLSMHFIQCSSVCMVWAGVLAFKGKGEFTSVEQTQLLCEVLQNSNPSNSKALQLIGGFFKKTYLQVVFHLKKNISITLCVCIVTCYSMCDLFTLFLLSLLFFALSHALLCCF